MRVTLEEFLAMPETEPPCELWDGEVIQKVAPSYNHGTLSSYLIRQLGNYLERTGEGRVVNEVRHVQRDEERVYLPDVNVVLREHFPRSSDERRRGPVELVPDLAIEILSPSDSAGRILQRADFYMRVSVPLAWFIDPDTETVTVYRPGTQPRVHQPPDVVDALPVLRDFTLDLAALFAELEDN
jgi:Uma2 family endonuclease